MQTVTTIGLDIAKSVFQVHGVDAEGRRRLGGRTARNAEPVDPAIGTTHSCQCITECGLLTGTRSAEGIMASGMRTALTGRTHGCTDQRRNVKIPLANSEPSTHGTKRTCRPG
jgi:hypothetical protein